jgi:hypothetical protein
MNKSLLPSRRLVSVVVLGGFGCYFTPILTSLYGVRQATAHVTLAALLTFASPQPHLSSSVFIVRSPLSHFHSSILSGCVNPGPHDYRERQFLVRRIQENQNELQKNYNKFLILE